MSIASSAEAALVAKRHIFAMLDVDGDGVISLPEYLSRPHRLAEALGLGAEEPRVRTSVAAHEEVYAAMDADDDGRVTFEEYAGWAGTDAFDASCRPALGSLFDLADADGDGCLDREEFTLLRSTLGNAEDRARAAFDVLDADGDGRVEREEYLDSIRTYVSQGASPMAETLHTGAGA
ncbi:EF-hand domain-containing protein [Streptomyces sp. NPDC090445]|uniref:EF-hand domain-containing protein n=1 Tax=Streptomyces sp. NPDC090445 TaxID=3365963 RepID=UPI003823E929